MFKLFRDIHIIYNASCVVIGIILPFTITPLDSVLGFLWYFLLMLALAFLLMIAAVFWTDRRLARVNRMREDGDIAGYIAAYERLYGRNFPKNSHLRQFTAINLAAGYLAADGGHEKALVILDLLKDSFDEKTASSQNYLFYCNNMAVCHLRHGDTATAARWLDKMHRRMNEGKTGKASSTLTERVYRRNRAEIDLLEGRIEGLEPVLREFLNDAATNLDRAASQWRLLRLCLMQERTDEAQAFLDAILESAPESYYAADSRRCMDFQNRNSGEKI